MCRRPCGCSSHARMGGERRRPARATGPRCRGDRPVLACPIDRRLRLCAHVGTQHLFVVARRRSCVAPGVRRRFLFGGGARRLRAVRAARRAACSRAGAQAGAQARAQAALPKRFLVAQGNSARKLVTGPLGRSGPQVLCRGVGNDLLRPLSLSRGCPLHWVV